MNAWPSTYCVSKHDANNRAAREGTDQRYSGDDADVGDSWGKELADESVAWVEADQRCSGEVAAAHKQIMNP